MADPAYIDPATGVLTDGEAWVALNSFTVVGSADASITFTSGYNDAAADVGGVQAWDQYMDLVLICYTQLYGASYGSNNASCGCKINGGSTASTSNQTFVGNGTAASANLETFTDGRFRWNDCAADGSTATEVFSASIVQFFDINSGKYKSVFAQNANDYDGAGTSNIRAITWMEQAPISSLDLYSWSGSIDGWSIGTRFDLFGVLPRMVA